MTACVVTSAYAGNNSLAKEFLYLHLFAAHGIISVFTSSYLCERAFCKMKYVNSTYRSSLSDMHVK
jgi:hypothetical protein